MYKGRGAGPSIGENFGGLDTGNERTYVHYWRS